MSRHQQGKTNLDLLEQEIVSGSGISWAICKLHLDETHNHASIPPLIFYRPDTLPAAKSTASSTEGISCREKLRNENMKRRSPITNKKAVLLQRLPCDAPYSGRTIRQYAHGLLLESAFVLYHLVPIAGLTYFTFRMPCSSVTSMQWLLRLVVGVAASGCQQSV